MAACAVGQPFWAWTFRPVSRACPSGPDSPPLSGQGRSPGHPGGGRLWPSPHGDSLHPDRLWPGPFLTVGWWWPSSPTATAAPGPCCRNFFPFSKRPRWFLLPRFTGPESRGPFGLSGRSVFEGVWGTGHPGVHFIEENREKADYIFQHLSAGDLVLTLGAGDIWKTGEELLARLQNQAAA